MSDTCIPTPHDFHALAILCHFHLFFHSFNELVKWRRRKMNFVLCSYEKEWIFYRILQISWKWDFFAFIILYTSHIINSSLCCICVSTIVVVMERGIESTKSTRVCTHFSDLKEISSTFDGEYEISKYVSCADDGTRYTSENVIFSISNHVLLMPQYCVSLLFLMCVQMFIFNKTFFLPSPSLFNIFGLSTISFIPYSFLQFTVPFDTTGL